LNADRTNVYHIPVLLQESMEALAIKTDGVYVDATAGGGGHLRELAARLDSRGTAVGIDRDPDAIARCKAHLGSVQPTVILEQSPFSRLDMILKSHGLSAIDGLLLDLGVSSHQIDDGPRGFSYMQDAKLDMRMDPSQGISAAEFLAASDEHELARILSSYGEIRNPMRMARAFVRYAAHKAMNTSGDVRQCLTEEYGPALPIKVIAKVFQAVRIAVNNELSELAACLGHAVSYVKKGGRIVIISYHSLEDRIVKNFIRDNEQPCRCPQSIPYCICGKKILLKRINKKVIIPTDIEVQSNPRARSARMRVAEKVDMAENGKA
jgi:16S rRNA (cytosine1402-N4)-methyltransferase